MGLIVVIVGAAALCYPIAMLAGAVEFSVIGLVFAVAAWAGLIQGLRDKP